MSERSFLSEHPSNSPAYLDGNSGRWFTRADIAAGVALLRLWQALDSRFPGIVGPKSVWTTGKVTFDPGAPSVIPGKAEMLFQFRDIEPNRLALLEQTVKELIMAADAAGHV